MTAQAASADIKPRPDAAVSDINHVGHVVRHIETALNLYRRMGFVMPWPSFPALAPYPGAPVRAFGAGNTHISFRHSFVELVTVVDDRRGGVVGADATLVPLQAPPDALDRLTDSITQTATRLATALDRFEGLHILVFGTVNVDATVTRLATQGVMHGPVNRLQRPAGSGGDPKPVSIGYVEIDSEPGLSPEGRLALVEDGPADSTLATEHNHPNGAVELVESLLCVPDVDLADYERRYGRYLQRPARSEGPLRVFDLDHSRVMIIPRSALETVLPGAAPPALPAFVGYGVAVHDLAASRTLLEQADFPVLTSPLGGVYVPATAALGAAVLFHSTG
jgi:Glyoxalase-like domain